MLYKIPSFHPHSPWPEESSHIPLGIEIHRLQYLLRLGDSTTSLPPEFIQELDRMSVKKVMKDKIPSVIVPSLRCYHRLYGHLLVRYHFKVPAKDPWNVSNWGSCLGTQVRYLRRIRSTLSDEIVTELTRLGFVWHFQQDELPENAAHSNHAYARFRTSTFPCLRHYHKLHGHGNVPQKFIVPVHDSTWPEKFHGQALGMQVSHLRAKAGQLSPATIHMFEQDLGFVWNVAEHQTLEREQKLVELIRHFYNLYHHVHVPQNFVISTEGPAWPDEYVDFQLGRFVATWRKNATKLSPEARAELTALGFDWKPRRGRKANIIRLLESGGS